MHGVVRRYTLWLVVCLILSFFPLAAIGVSPKQEFVTDGVTPTRVFSPFGPPTRVLVTARGMRFVGEPIRFDVRVPPLTETVTVTFLFETGSGCGTPAIGVLQHQRLVALYPMTIAIHEGVSESSVTFSLQGHTLQDGALGLVLSLRDVSPREPCEARTLHLLTERPSLRAIATRILQAFRARSL